MNDDHVTITLPISAHGLGVIFFILGVVVMSGVVYALLPRDRPVSDWLTRLQKRTGLEDWHPLPFIALALTWAIVALTLFGGLYTAIWEMIFQKPPEGREAVWNWRFSVAQLVALTTVLGAVIALPITVNRLLLTRRQTNTIEQGHITDRINTAVQGLGTEKTVKVHEFVQKYATEDGKKKKDDDGNPIHLKRGDGSLQGRWDVSEETTPNLEVRIGAIYALERIAQDSDRDHVQIMEILCAYIRQNAPAPVEGDWPALEMKDSEDEGPLEADWEKRLNTFREKQNEKKATLKLREDIQTALTVIGRRTAKQRQLEAGHGVRVTFPFDTLCPNYVGPDDSHDKDTPDAYLEQLKAWKDDLEAYGGYRLNLRKTDLRGADLTNLNFNGASFSGVHFQGAVLLETRLKGAGLLQAQFEGAILMNAQMQGAHLWQAQLQVTTLKNASLQGANLIGARLQGTHLNYVRAEGANLDGARLQGALLDEARFQGALLDEARLQGANLGKARFHGTRLAGARIDGRTILTKASLRGTAVNRVDFTNVPDISAHLPDMFGDASVTLPGGHRPDHESWPAHWPKFEFGKGFDEEWRKWQRDPEGYRPPDPPIPKVPA